MELRRHYLDNLRGLALLLLIPYHTAQAWNTWGEPNYVFFTGNRAISSIIVFLSPYYMPLLFVLAGISARLALQKRTPGEYLTERVRRLLVPLLFGTVTLMPVMAFLGDRFNCGYGGTFLRHYAVFFTKFTDLTGADGGFSVGQFWFLLYLFLISPLGSGLPVLLNKIGRRPGGAVPLWLVPVLGLPLPLLHGWLSIGGKSLAADAYFFLLGYFVFSDGAVMAGLEKRAGGLSAAGLLASVLNVYLFLWAGSRYALLNAAAKYVSEWVMTAALLGLAKRYLDFDGKWAEFLRKYSFPFYFWHFIWVVLFQYLLYQELGGHTAPLFLGTVLLSYGMTLLCCEITLRSPLLCRLTGSKFRPGP